MRIMLGLPTPEIDDDSEIQLINCPILWTKEKFGGEHQYVTDVLVNHMFAILKVLNSQLIREYVIFGAMYGIEKKFEISSVSPGRYCEVLGQRLNLDRSSFVVSRFQGYICEMTGPHNQVSRHLSVGLVSHPQPSGKGSTNDRPYDLYYMPGYQLITCSINTNKLPDSLAFSDERIIVKLNEKTLMDAYIPFFIDLEKPVKYEFDYKLHRFRAVFKIKESQS